MVNFRSRTGLSYSSITGTVRLRISAARAVLFIVSTKITSLSRLMFALAQEPEIQDRVGDTPFERW